MISQTTATKLIKIYDYVCFQYEKELQYHVQRFSNNASPDFTDQEIMTIYLFGVHQERRLTVKQMHSFIKDYLPDWFPKLPSYTAFCTRLNRLSEAFKYLSSDIFHNYSPENTSTTCCLIDSLPIITCSGKREAKVACELVDKTYNATKGIWYHGVKVHILGFETAYQVPHPEYIIISKASEHDLSVLKESIASIENRIIFADKAYCDKAFGETISKEQNVQILTPIKATKGLCESLKNFDRAADEMYSKAISRTRQPIESLFHWIIEKTDIQRASKIRSANGLLVHIYGKIAAAFLKLIF